MDAADSHRRLLTSRHPPCALVAYPQHIRLFHYIRNASIRMLILGIMKRQFAIAGRALCVEVGRRVLCPPG